MVSSESNVELERQETICTPLVACPEHTLPGYLGRLYGPDLSSQQLFVSSLLCASRLFLASSPVFTSDKVTAVVLGLEFLQEVDKLQMRLAACYAQRDRLLLELGELEEELGRENALAAEAGKGSSSQNVAATEGHLLQHMEQQDEEGGSGKAVGSEAVGEQLPAVDSAAQRASSGTARGWAAAWAARRATRRQERLQKLRGRLAAAEEAVRQAREAVEAKRREVLEGPPCSTFFVTFKTQEAAMLAANVNLNPLKERMFQVMSAPEPDDVNWGTVQRG